MKSETLNDKYKPVPLNLKEEVARAMRRPGFKAAWNALEEEYTTLAAPLEARKQVCLATWARRNIWPCV